MSHYVTVCEEAVIFVVH